MSFLLDAQALKRWMKNQKLRPEDVSSKAKISFGTVQRALRGESISQLTLSALMNFTGLTEDELLGKTRHREGKREVVS